MSSNGEGDQDGSKHVNAPALDQTGNPVDAESDQDDAVTGENSVRPSDMAAVSSIDAQGPDSLQQPVIPQPVRKRLAIGTQASGNKYESRAMSFYMIRLLYLAIMGGIGGLLDLLLRIHGICGTEDKYKYVYGSVSLFLDILMFILAGAAAGLFVTVLLAGKDLELRSSFIRGLVLALAGGLFWYPVFELTRSSVTGISEVQIIAEKDAADGEVKSRSAWMLSVQDETIPEEQKKQITQKTDEASKAVVSSIRNLEYIPPNSPPFVEVARSAKASVDNLEMALQNVAKKEIIVNGETHSTNYTAVRQIDKNISDIMSAAMDVPDSSVQRIFETDTTGWPRVYIKCPESSIDKAKNLRKALMDAKEFIVPDVEISTDVFDKTTAFYYYVDDLAAAQQVAAIIDKNFNLSGETETRYELKTESIEKLRPGHIEVWVNSPEDNTES